jgi:zinc transporter ZupT
MGSTMFHLLPHIAEGSSHEQNQLLTSIVLITISLMILIDCFIASKSQSVNQSCNKVHSGVELQSDNVPQHVVPIEKASDSEASKADSSPSSTCMTYAELLRKPDVMVNLMGEALHNLNDGIAIATAFSLSWQSGELIMQDLTKSVLERVFTLTLSYIQQELQYFLQSSFMKFRK